MESIISKTFCEAPTTTGATELENKYGRDFCLKGDVKHSFVVKLDGIPKKLDNFFSPCGIATACTTQSLTHCRVDDINFFLRGCKIADKNRYDIVFTSTLKYSGVPLPVGPK